MAKTELAQSGLLFIETEEELEALKAEYFPPVDPASPESLAKIYCTRCRPAPNTNREHTHQ